MRFDRFCRWCVSDMDVWQVMLKLNTAAVRRVQQHALPQDTVISMSHFLPHSQLRWSPGFYELAKAVGCKELQHQLDAVSACTS